MNRLQSCLLFFALMVFAGPAPAQQYPNKPIRFVVGFAPGGATDIIARALSLKLAESMGQQVVVDNRASGGGRIAAEITAKAPPEIGERLAVEGSEPGGSTPDEFASFIKREIAKWARVVRESGLKAD